MIRRRPPAPRGVMIRRLIPRLSMTYYGVEA